jgi:hypothetical protein
MIWSIYVPLVSLILFAVWMVRITLKARASLRRIDAEVTQLSELLSELESDRHTDEPLEHWLGDTYTYIAKNSFNKNNPLIELIRRFYAMSELASPDLLAALESITAREVDKLEVARETPGHLLLLGIMGTVVGMVVALSTFGAANFQGTGTAVNIGQIMSSMFLAFISTGIALFFSVSTRGYLEKVSLRQADMLAEMESYAFSHLAPLFLPKQDRTLQQRFHELMNQQQHLLAEALEKSATTLSAFAATLAGAEELTRNLNTTMTESSERALSLGERMTGELQQVGSALSSKLLDGLELVSKELSTQHATFKTSTRDMVAALEASNRATHQAFETSSRDALLALEHEKHITQQHNERLQERFAETITLLNDNNVKLVRNMGTMTKHFATQSEEQTAAINALRQDVLALSERLEASQERYQQTFLETVQSFLYEQFTELARSFGLRRRN